MTGIRTNAVLKHLASQAHVNIVIDDNVQRRVSIQLKDVPFDEAVRAIVSCTGFEVSQEGEVLSVRLPSLRPSSRSRANSRDSE